MPLSAESVYNDLNGAECQEILETRFRDLLSTVPEFRRFLTLCRVRMTLSVRLEVAGSTPPVIELRDDLVIRTRDAPTDPVEDVEVDLKATINSDTLHGGQPPDQVRVEHGLPVPTPTRNPQTGILQDKPVVREGRKWGGFHELDRGGPVLTGNMEYQHPVEVKQHGNPDVGLQEDFRKLQSDIKDERMGKR